MKESLESLSVRTTVDAQWELGGQFVVARSVASIVDERDGAVRSTSESVSWFTWDGKADEYRYWTFASDGAVSSGTMGFDPGHDTWTLQEMAWDASVGRWVETGWGTMQFLCESEKIVHWSSRPLTGGGFDSEGRSIRVREH